MISGARLCRLLLKGRKNRPGDQKAFANSSDSQELVMESSNASMEKWVRDTAGMELAVPNYEGVRVNYKVPPASQGWFLLRKSLHEPFMSLDIESDTEGGADAILIFSGSSTCLQMCLCLY